MRKIFFYIIITFIFLVNCSSDKTNSKPKNEKKTQIPLTIHLESDCNSDSLVIERNNIKEYYNKKPFITGENINLISLTSGLVKKYDVIIEFDQIGTKIIKEVTTKNIDKKVAIIFDGELITAPLIRMPIENGKIMISGAWENEEKVYNFVKKLEKEIEKK